ncbi:MAG: hypothetical protein ACI4NZ_03690, partial [Candidatus Enterousia sp.]
MGNFVKTINSFANGDIAPEFYTHDNLSGLSALINMDVIAGGGLRRRAGLGRVAELGASARLISFSVGQDDEYILAITAGHIYVYNGATRVCDIIAPWTASDIAQIQYAQRFGTMIFVHPEYQPRILRKTAIGFDLTTFEFARSDDDMTVHM